jgi:hypothetical protein
MPAAEARLSTECGAAGFCKTSVTARQALVLERHEDRRGVVGARQVLAQQQNQALLHEGLGHGLGADARLGDLREHEIEGMLDEAVARQVLDERLAQGREQA